MTETTNSTGSLRLTIAVILLILTLVGPAFGTYIVLVLGIGAEDGSVIKLFDVIGDFEALGFFMASLPLMITNLVVAGGGIRRYPAISRWFTAIFATSLAAPLGLAGFSFLFTVVTLSGPNGSS
ncbi:MAG: hypothetical protein GY895_14815 [Phycisphaera sp.]|nr:hypothetical protein [Phycisphaera sp.]